MKARLEPTFSCRHDPLDLAAAVEEEGEGEIIAEDRRGAGAVAGSDAAGEDDLTSSVLELDLEALHSQV